MSSENKKARRRRLTERLQTLRERVRLLELELGDYTSNHFRVCIFGSARLQPQDDIYQMTQKIGQQLGKRGIDVLTGGGPGLMEAANKGVLEGQAESGSKSKSFGITIELGELEPPSDHLDIKHHHQKFSSRLDDFMRLSNAIIVVPGGIGTLLELYFSWQLLQVGHMTERPIVLVGKSFWKGLIEWMKTEQVSNGLVSPGDLRWVHLVDTPEETTKIIEEELQKFSDRLAATGEDEDREKIDVLSE